MKRKIKTTARCGGLAVVAALGLALDLLPVIAASPAIAAGCAFEPQGEGRVAAVIDARSFRLQDGREVRLAGIEPVAEKRAASALSAIIAGREVTLRGEDDTPDRYGRQPAFVYLVSSETPVQARARGAGRGAGLG